MVKYPITLNSHLVGLVDIWCRVVKIGYKSIADTLSAILFWYRLRIAETFLNKYQYRYRRYFLSWNIRYFTDTFSDTLFYFINNKLINIQIIKIINIIADRYYKTHQRSINDVEFSI